MGIATYRIYIRKRGKCRLVWRTKKLLTLEEAMLIVNSFVGDMGFSAWMVREEPNGKS